MSVFLNNENCAFLKNLCIFNATHYCYALENANFDFCFRFHGPISRTDANALLNNVDGRYLIRESWRGEQEYTLAIV